MTFRPQSENRTSCRSAFERRCRHLANAASTRYSHQATWRSRERRSTVRFSTIDRRRPAIGDSIAESDDQSGALHTLVRDKIESAERLRLCRRENLQLQAELSNNRRLHEFLSQELLNKSEEIDSVQARRPPIEASPSSTSFCHRDSATRIDRRLRRMPTSCRNKKPIGRKSMISGVSSCREIASSPVCEAIMQICKTPMRHVQRRRGSGLDIDACLRRSMGLDVCTRSAESRVAASECGAHKKQHSTGCCLLDLLNSGNDSAVLGDKSSRISELVIASRSLGTV